MGKKSSSNKTPSGNKHDFFVRIPDDKFKKMQKQIEGYNKKETPAGSDEDTLSVQELINLSTRLKKK